MSTIASALTTTTQRVLVATGIALAALSPIAIASQIASAPTASADDHGSSNTGGNHSRYVREGRAGATANQAPDYRQSHPTPPHSTVAGGSMNHH